MKEKINQLYALAQELSDVLNEFSRSRYDGFGLIVTKDYVDFQAGNYNYEFNLKYKTVSHCVGDDGFAADLLYRQFKDKPAEIRIEFMEQEYDYLLQTKKYYEEEISNINKKLK